MFSDAATVDTAVDLPTTWRRSAPPTGSDAYDLWRVEANRIVLDVALACHHADTSIYEIGCHTGQLLAELAGRLAVAQRASRLVGVEGNERSLRRAEERLRSWLSEHEISLQATLPDTMPRASVVIVNETETRLSAPARRNAMATAAAGLMPNGVLLFVGNISSTAAPLRGLQTFADADEIAACRAAGFKRIEPLLRWHDLVVTAAFAD